MSERARYHLVDSRGSANGPEDASAGSRRKWWWQSGPVESCCFCFSLRTGVILLALHMIFKGLFLVEMLPILRSLNAFNEAIYDEGCLDTVVMAGVDCAHLRANMDKQNEIVAQLEPKELYLTIWGTLSSLFGIVGISAACTGRARRAKVFMFAFPVLLLADQVLLSDSMKVEQIWKFVLNFVEFMYYFKVAWSFYKRLSVFERRVAEEQSLLPNNANVQQTVMRQTV